MKYLGFVLLLSSATVLGACFDTPTADISFRCGAAGECPDNYECRTDGCCHLLGSAQDQICDLADAQPPPMDASPIDGMADAGPDAIVDATPDAMVDAGPGPILVDLAPTNALLAPGQTVSLTATLDIPAPAGGTSITISSSDAAVASVPASVTVPENAMDITIPVSAQASGTATISATLGPDSFDATITVATVSGNAGDVVIDEFLALSSMGGNSGEFIELVNISANTLDISGWVVASDGVQNIILAPSLDSADPVFVAPDVAIFGVPNPADPASIPAAAAFVYGPAGGAIDLGDTGANLRIGDGTTDVDIVDFTGWETGPTNTPSANQFAGLVDRSTQLDPGYRDALDNDDGARWCVPGAPTPGIPNPLCDTATIDEFFADPTGVDEGLEFIELRVVPGADIGNLRLRSTSSDGTPTGLDLTVAAGTRGSLDGFWVVADNTGAATQVTNADLEAPLSLPDTDAGLQLIRATGSIADAIGYGTLTATVDTVDGLPIVEGTAVANAEGSSLSRDADGTDTNQNSADLHQDPTPTPGTPSDPVPLAPLKKAGRGR